ncbi:MAG: hypothetical protein HY699_12215 [Deltaproteobacteria bacterium]|nr:hypothetical protein [Deltaproteobacteria bacterium]
MTTLSLATAVEEAELLLAFAVRRGLLADQTLAAAVSECRQAVATTTPLADESRFWSAFNRLAALVQPATVESIRATTPAARDGSDSKADEAVKRYRNLALATLVTLVAAQVYYLVGATAISRIDSYLKELEAASGGTEVQGQLVELAVSGTQAPASRLDNAEGYKRVRLDFSYRQLATWNRVWETPLELAQLQWPGNPASVLARSETCKRSAGANSVPESNQTPPVTGEQPAAELAAPDGGGQSPARVATSDCLPAGDAYGLVFNPFDGDNIVTETRARLALKTMSAYVLPFLYGLLGTCVFILRNLGEGIRSYSFSSDVGYRVRLPLGALAGVAMASIMSPESMPSALRSLPSITLAFVAGYSVEIWFAMMDRVIGAFSNTDQTAVKSK